MAYAYPSPRCVLCAVSGEGSPCHRPGRQTCALIASSQPATTACPAAVPLGTPEVLPYPIQGRMSSTSACRASPGCQPHRRVRAACGSARQSSWGGVGGGGRGRLGGANAVQWPISAQIGRHRRQREKPLNCPQRPCALPVGSLPREHEAGQRASAGRPQGSECRNRRHARSRWDS